MAEHSYGGAETSSQTLRECCTNGQSVSKVVYPISHNHHPHQASHPNLLLARRAVWMTMLLSGMCLLKNGGALRTGEMRKMFYNATVQLCQYGHKCSQSYISITFQLTLQSSKLPLWIQLYTGVLLLPLSLLMTKERALKKKVHMSETFTTEY